MPAKDRGVSSWCASSTVHPLLFRTDICTRDSCRTPVAGSSTVPIEEVATHRMNNRQHACHSEENGNRPDHGGGGTLRVEGDATDFLLAFAVTAIAKDKDGDYQIGKI